MRRDCSQDHCTNEISPGYFCHTWGGYSLIDRVVEGPAVRVGLAFHPSGYEEGLAEARLRVVVYRDWKAIG